MSKNIIFTFGIFNPPTLAHRALVNSVFKNAKNAEYFIFVDREYDVDKKPLEWHEKLGLMRSMFPYIASGLVQNEDIVSLKSALIYLQNNRFTDLKYVCGSDKVQMATYALNKWNQNEKDQGRKAFNSINIISSGQPDPDTSVSEGINSYNARQLVKNNDFQGFKAMIGDGKIAKDLFTALTNGMRVKSTAPISLSESSKKSLKNIIISMLKEEEFDEKDRAKIVALRKKTAASRVKEKSEVEKSVKDQLKAKQDAFKLALKDTSDNADDKIEAARTDLEKAKQSADSAKKITTAAKSELSSIK
jgi:hypothetical protein